MDCVPDELWFGGLVMWTGTLSHEGQRATHWLGTACSGMAGLAARLLFCVCESKGLGSRFSGRPELIVILRNFGLFAPSELLPLQMIQAPSIRCPRFHTADVLLLR